MRRQNFYPVTRAILTAMALSSCPHNWSCAEYDTGAEALRELRDIIRRHDAVVTHPQCGNPAEKSEFFASLESYSETPPPSLAQ